MSSIDSVEVAVGALEHLRDLAARALEHVDRADDLLAQRMDDAVAARVHVIAAGVSVDDIRRALDRLLETAAS